MNLNLFADQTIKIHYQRLNGDYDGWSMWIWDSSNNKPGFEKKSEGRDSFGVYFLLNPSSELPSASKIGILPRYGEWINKEGFDRILNYSGQKEIFIIEGDKEIYFQMPEISTKIVSVSASQDGNISVFFNKKINLEFFKKKKIYLSCGGKDILFNSKISPQYSLKADLIVEKPINRDDILSGNCFIKGDFGDFKVDASDLIYGDDFYFDGNLGVLKENSKTVFRVFSPLSKKVDLILKKDPYGEEKIFPLEKKEKGIWEYSSYENLEGFCYLYQADYGDKKLRGIDPYGKSVIGDKICSVIYFEDGEEVYPSPSFPLSQTVIYEMSVRDMTSDVNSGVKNAKKYLGLTEENTYNPSFPQIKTGLAHLKELGVNAVHILPVQDFEKDENSDAYDWGYMPVNFNSPEGQYAAEKNGIGRVKELKKMISALHKNGIKAIMDVVYNHTAETKDKIYNFNALAYDYFYRRKTDGSYYNGSGCGNEFKTESPMGRKFILDSLKYWIKEYKVDGFRFDLMGLIDEETAYIIASELKKINPEIIIYGEPWHAGGTPVKGVKKGSQKNKGFSVFNDDLRDAIKGSVFHIEDLGYVQSGNYADKVKKGIKGSLDLFAANPYESINYVSCHDNNTLFDRIDLSVKDETLENKIKMDKLAQAIVFVSQGIPFLHSGEEILRTKNGEENSYNLGDEINKIDWNRKKQYYEVFLYYKDLIKMRKEHPAFSMPDSSSVLSNLKFYEDLKLPIQTPQIGFVIDGKYSKDTWGKIAVLINPDKQKKSFVLPEGKWKLRFSQKGLENGNNVYEKKIEVPSISLFVLSEN
ncbi:MAG: type I pullulanase [Elusimicrobiota bacterium]